MARIVITGASGFVGRAATEAALAASHTVVALGRRTGHGPNGCEYHALDLVAADAAEALASILKNADAVIHAAAAMAGDDAAHERDTLGPMRTLLNAIGSLRLRLVLVSSFSVYGFAALPEDTLLTELTPLEPEPHKRDAYTRAKLAQEALAVEASRTTGLDLWLIRPGAIYGPGRLDTARLGIPCLGRRLSPGSNPMIPAVDVARVSEGLVAAATVSAPQNRDVSGPHRHPAIIVNLTDTDPPRQGAWAAAAGIRVTRLPRALFFKTATALDLVGDLIPGFGRRLPKALLPPRLAARFRHLRYGTQRAEDILGLHPGPASADRIAAYAGRRT